MGEQYVLYQDENSTSGRDIDRRYYLDFAFRRNIHANPEFIYVYDGELEVTIDGNRMEASAGRFCVVLPWQVHSFHTPRHSQCVVLVVANQYVDIFTKNMLGYYGETQVFEAEREVNDLFLKHLFQGPFADEYIITSVLLALCHCFVDKCKLVSRFERQKIPALYNVMHYISQHCNDELTLRDVSDALGYSYYYLSHIFKAYVGMSFRQFCNMRRVSDAQYYLRHTNASLTDVAFESGFASVRNFNRVFGSVMMITPGEYRAKYSKLVNGVRISLDEGFVQVRT